MLYEMWLQVIASPAKADKMVYSGFLIISCKLIMH